MDDRSLLREALDATYDTLVTLAHTLVVPWAAEQYCKRCQVPPVTLPTEWSDGVAALRDRYDTLDDAEKLAQILLHVEGIYHAVDAIVDHEGNPNAGIEFLRRLILPVLLAKLRERGTTFSIGLYTILMGLVVADERLKEETPDVFITERWAKFLMASAIAGGLKEDPDAPGESAARERRRAAEIGAGIVGTYYLLPLGINALLHRLAPKASPFRWPFEAFFHAGFDHPDGPLLEQPLDAARHSFVAFFNKRTTALDEAAYQTFDPPESPWKHRVLSLALVPLARSPLPEVPDAHGGALYLQVGAMSLEIETRTDDSYLKLALGGSGGLIIPLGGGPIPDTLPTASLSATLDAAYTVPPDDDQPAGEDDDDVPDGVSFTVRRFAVSFRAAVLPTQLGLTLRLEGAELRIGKLPVLDVVFPAGIRVEFDFGILASAGGGVRLEGGLGGEVEMPLDFHARVGGEKYEIFDARIRSVRVGISRRDNGIRIELAANASARLGGILSVHADGAGVALTLASKDEPTGNLAIADFAWEPIFPAGIGIELKVWKLQGGGYLRYDPPTKRLVGAAQLKIGSLFTINSSVGTALARRSWSTPGTASTSSTASMCSSARRPARSR